MRYVLVQEHLKEVNPSRVNHVEEEDKLDHNKVSFRFNKLVPPVREQVQQYLILVIHVVVLVELKKQKI